MRPSSGYGSGLPPAAAGQGYDRRSNGPTAAPVAQRGGPLPQRTPFGPSAPDVEVTPRLACNKNGSNYEGEEVQKPHTGMTIRLTPELLSRFRRPGPKPRIELVLNNAGEGQLSLFLFHCLSVHFTPYELKLVCPGFGLLRTLLRKCI